MWEDYLVKLIGTLKQQQESEGQGPDKGANIPLASCNLLFLQL